MSGGVREPGRGAVGVRIARVGDRDLGDLLPLARAYCDFYGVSPADDALLDLSRALIADPEHEGIQLLARDLQERPVGFATVFWLWSTLGAARVGLMNDLFVDQDARGTGAADALIEACRAACRERGATRLTWQTAKDNGRARAVYDRVGGHREEWLDYWLEA